MFVPFASIPSSSRIWIFQASRPLSAQELLVAAGKLQQFTAEWAVHGAPFDTSYTIKYDQFIILAADESRQNASGCSIDSSVRVLKELENLLGLDLLDRNNVAFKLDGQVALMPLKDLKQNFQEGILNEETLTFNNLISTRAELESKWLVPAGETWLKRYIKNPLANVR